MKETFFVVLIMSIFGCYQAHAATKEDVARAIDLMKLAKNSGKFLDYKDYKRGAFRAVYVVDGTRYTAYYAPNAPGSWLHFQMRPNGTTDGSLLDDVIDRRLDGEAEFGISSQEDGDMFFDLSLGAGCEYQSVWQETYDRSIADAIRRFE